MTFMGGCSCGAIRYTLMDEPLFVQACHCIDCQRLTGSAFVINMWLESSIFKIGQGNANSFQFHGGSGQPAEVYFCGCCSTVVWSEYQASPAGTLFVRASTLDDASLIKPLAHIYTKSKQSWLSLPADIPSFTEFYKLKEIWPEQSLERLRKLRQQSD